MRPDKQTLPDRFWAKVKRGAPDECWPWMGGRCGLRGEYGSAFMNGRNTVAHRVAWLLSHETPIPDGMDICHTCDNGLCCNPAHLWLGTHQDNMLDKEKKGRGNHWHGTRHPHAKLREQDIPIILSLLKEGRTRKEIGQQFGVSAVAITYIAQGKKWRHVSGIHSS